MEVEVEVEGEDEGCGGCAVPAVEARKRVLGLDLCLAQRGIAA